MIRKLIILVAASVPFLFASCGGKELNPDIPEEFFPVAVDLGLTVKWADRNVGAYEPEENGTYYVSWGETALSRNYAWGNYKWCKGSSTSLTKYNTDPTLGVVDNKTKLEANDDLATVKYGGKWRMPTVDDLNELAATKDNPDYKWEWKLTYNHNGWEVLGWEITYLVNGNSMFLPAASYINGVTGGSHEYGYYWSSSLNLDFPVNAWSLTFSAEGVRVEMGLARFHGFPIRAVCD